MPWWPHRQLEVARTFEGNTHSASHLDRLAVQQEWFVLPLFDCVHSGLSQKEVAHNGAHLAYGAVFADFDGQQDFTLNVDIPRHSWVDGVHMFEQVAFHGFLRKAQIL